MIRTAATLILVICYGSVTHGQAPCLDGWKYRLEIEVENLNASPLLLHQVELLFDTEQLVNDGKARVDGGDFRFQNANGDLLNYWFDPTTYNNPSMLTSFWIKIDAIPTGTSNIYVYYGNATCSVVSSGEGTFEFFDSFDGGTIAPSKWGICGDGANVQVAANRDVDLTYNATDNDTYMITDAGFNNVQVEMKVNSVSSGVAFIGLLDSTDGHGFATAYEHIGGADKAKLMWFDPLLPAFCDSLKDFPTVSSYNVSSINGIWGLNWPADNTHNIFYPNGTQLDIHTDLGVFGNKKRIILGVTSSTTHATGALNFDWVRARKYAAFQPTSKISTTDFTEYEAPLNPNQSNTGPYCEGDNIELTSDNFEGAQYNWFDNNSVLIATTNNYTSGSASTLLNAGVYTLEVGMPGDPVSCAVNSITTEVSIAPGTFTGSIVGPGTNICSGTNSGTLELGNLVNDIVVGDILRWEMANSSVGPWATLTNTTRFLDYQNVVGTTFYRAVVKSGGCPEIISQELELGVDQATEGGFLLGTASVCSGNNSGDLNLVYHNGYINGWESYDVPSGIWQPLNPNNDPLLLYSGLVTTTKYRAEIQNGVCPTEYSSEVTITVNENPVAGFFSDTVCQGFTTTVTDTTRIAAGSGTIISWAWDLGNGNGSIAQNPQTVFPAALPSVNQVSLTVETDRGCTHTASQNVIVNALPIVNYTSTDVCLGDLMNFTTLSPTAGPNIEYDWFFVGDTTCIQRDTSIIFKDPGPYDVTLVVTSPESCIDSMTNTILVNTPVDVDFICDSVCLGEPINFINTSISPGSTVQYTWFFGDGQISATLNPVHTYADTGNVDVILRADIGSGPSACSREITKTVRIYEVPEAVFSVADICQIDSAEFLNSSSYNSGNGANDLTYVWDFGDASSSTLSEDKHKYSLPNNYTVGLRAASPEGCVHSSSSILVVNAMPVSGFSYTDVCLNEPMIFTSTSSPSNLTYDWSLDDGTSNLTQENPNHTYTQDGSYDVQLVVETNVGNCRDTTTKTVFVYPVPEPMFTVTDTCDGIASVFTDQSDINTPGNNTSWVWDFGDGSSSSSQNPSHLFLNVGTYNVKLTVTSDNGCWREIILPATLDPLPVPNFTVEDACEESEVLFFNTTPPLTGTITYDWDFSDGDYSTFPNPTHEYAAPGFYQVQLVAITGEGCKDSITKYAEVFVNPVVDAGNDTSVSQGFEVELSAFYPGATVYNWSPEEGLDNNSIFNPNASPLDTTTYSVSVTDYNGCIGEGEVTVNVIMDYKLFIHNVITPDGNGQNDTWKITNIETFETADVYVYDRWGMEVLKVQGYQNEWNGIKGTDQLPDGTYYYIIKIKFGKGEEKIYKGSLTVLRNK